MSTKVPVHVELFYDNDWHDLTAADEIYTRDPIEISRGRSAESQRVSPAEMDLSIKNTGDHKYSPRNPMSPLYGKIGRNQPIRCWVELMRDEFDRTVTNGWGITPDGRQWLTFSGGAGSSNLNVGGGLGNHVVSNTLTFRATVLDIANTANVYRDCEVRTRWTLSSPSISGAAVEPANIMLRWVSANTYYFLRVEILAGNTVRYHIRKVIGGVETQVGATITTGIVFSGQTLAAAFGAEGPVLYAKVWDPAIGEPYDFGAYALDFDLPNAGGVGVRSGVAGGNTNLPVTTSYDHFEVRIPRVYAEVESWPQRWNTRGTDVWAPIKANGIMRRLGGAGTKALGQSAIRRAISNNQSDLVAYWPMEDGSPLVNAFSPNVPGSLIDGRMEAISDGPAGSSGAARIHAPQSLVGLSYGGTVSLPVAGYEPSATSITIGFAMRQIREPTLTSETGTFSIAGNIGIRTTGSDFLFNWASDPDGVFGSSVILIPVGSGTSAEGDVEIGDGEWHHVVLTLETNGSDVDGTIFFDGVQVASTTFPSETIGRVTDLVNFGAEYFDPDTATSHAYYFDICHIAVYDASSGYASFNAFRGHAGESAGTRFVRLCTEQGITHINIPLVFSTFLGPQKDIPFLELLYQAAEADGGILMEARGFPGLKLLTHGRRLNQSPTATLTYGADGEVRPPLQPSEDTDHVQNDVTVTREGGGSSTVVQDVGPLNVQEPSEDDQGVGRYPVDVTLNLFADSQTLQQAAWIKHLGTWDEPRYPTIPLDVTALVKEGKIGLVNAIVSLNVGERLVINDPPIWQGPDAIDQQVQGYREILASHHWTIDDNTTPYGPWDVGTLDGSAGLDTAGCTLDEDLTTTETELSVTSVGVPWRFVSGTPYDIVIGGERMTVTGVNTIGSLSQILTVTRSVNGVVKTHSTGDAIRIAEPLRLARGA